MADLEIFAKMDDVFELLMAKMGYEIPEFQVERNIRIKVDADKDTLKETYTVTGVDHELEAFDFLSDVMVRQVQPDQFPLEKQFLGDPGSNKVTLDIKKDY